MRRWEATLAERIGVDSPKFARMLAALDKAPAAQRSDLESLDAAAKPSVGQHIAPTTQQVANHSSMNLDTISAYPRRFR
jgi:hypothetical protein